MSIESDMHLTFEVPGKLRVESVHGLIRVGLYSESRYDADCEKYFHPSELRPLSRMLNRMIKRIEQENQK